ncbi:D-alanine--D-alanine ligase [Terrilactibacillus laevilacticus]|uniref:D-alanine--D-alanine ligase n=1 Tax=Terrilactibacillus laevilacticus TaxID=1380157 RepID=A0ABW5PQL4_9BACI|nr:D-alanine--D-alanine ligase [Terrilactibacillus laevilacticus]
MANKKTVAVLYGGKSAEYEISIQTAFSAINSIDLNKFRVLPIHITNNGKWIQGHEITEKIAYKDQLLLDEPQVDANPALWLTPTSDPSSLQVPDIVFPLLHGTNGEDGTVQGMLELLNIAYVGSGVMGSAAGMDKVIMKDIFAAHDIQGPRYVSVTKYEWSKNQDEMIKMIEEKIGYPNFVKPANLGSSVGISQCLDESTIVKAVDEAFRYDTKVIIEEKIVGREVEIGVIGNDELEVSVPGEIQTTGTFYDYQSKYQDGKSSMIIPADLPEDVLNELKKTAKKVFKVLNCKGLARVDVFIQESDHKVMVNEVNTLPGFTPFSMFPLLWKHTGLPYDQLIEKLIQLGIDRYQEKQTLRFRLED